VYFRYIKSLWLLFGKWIATVQKWLQIDQLRDLLLIECLGLVSLQGQGEESKDVEETKIGLELKLKCVRTWEFIILSPLFLFIFVIFTNTS